MSIDAIIKDINKKFKTDIIIKGTDAKKRTYIPFSSPLLNYMTRGGVCEGKMVEFFGVEGSSKTTLALDVIANFQKKYPDRGVYYLDAENTLDEEWARKLGINMEMLSICKPDNEYGERLLDMVIAVINSGAFGLVIIDSIPYIMPKQIADNSLENKTYAGNSALLTTFVNKVNPLMAKHNCTVLCINQVRDKMGVTYTAYGTPGGRMLKFAYVQRFQLKRDSYIDDNGKDMGTNPESPKGAIFQVSYVKNKVTKNDRRMQTFTLKFDTGVDVLSDTVELAIHLDIIHKNGAWFSYGDKKWQGQHNVIAELKENEELFNEILTKTNEMAIQ